MITWCGDGARCFWCTRHPKNIIAIRLWQHTILSILFCHWQWHRRRLFTFYPIRILWRMCVRKIRVINRLIQLISIKICDIQVTHDENSFNTPRKRNKETFLNCCRKKDLSEWKTISSLTSDVELKWHLSARTKTRIRKIIKHFLSYLQLAMTEEQLIFVVQQAHAYKKNKNSVRWWEIRAKRRESFE